MIALLNSRLIIRSGMMTNKVFRSSSKSHYRKIVGNNHIFIRFVGGKGPKDIQEVAKSTTKVIANNNSSSLGPNVTKSSAPNERTTYHPHEIIDRGLPNLPGFTQDQIESSREIKQVPTSQRFILERSQDPIKPIQVKEKVEKKEGLSSDEILKEPQPYLNLEEKIKQIYPTVISDLQLAKKAKIKNLEDVLNVELGMSYLPKDRRDNHILVKNKDNSQAALLTKAKSIPEDPMNREGPKIITTTIAQDVV